jgi:hypothetical protein
LIPVVDTAGLAVSAESSLRKEPALKRRGKGW